MTAYSNPYRTPPISPGMKVGLFGGSFNPPHDGHARISATAIRRLKLDQLWWCVSPCNPLKNHDDLPALEERMRECRKIATHPAIRVTAYETAFNVNHTVDALRILISRKPQVRFVWIMGSDNLVTFHCWKRWRKLASLVPVAIIDRPSLATPPHASPAGHALAQFRINERDASMLVQTIPPAWAFIHGPRSFLSSTRIRNERK